MRLCCLIITKVSLASSVSLGCLPSLFIDFYQAYILLWNLSIILRLVHMMYTIHMRHNISEVKTNQ